MRAFGLSANKRASERASKRTNELADNGETAKYVSLCACKRAGVYLVSVYRVSVTMSRTDTRERSFAYSLALYLDTSHMRAHVYEDMYPGVCTGEVHVCPLGELRGGQKNRGCGTGRHPWLTARSDRAPMG